MTGEPTECVTPVQQAERTTRDAAAAASADEQELPELTGSERQAAWATTLRADALAVLDAGSDFLDHDEHSDRSGDRDQEIRRIVDTIRTIYLATTAATKRIDYRTYQHNPDQLACIFATDEQKAELTRLTTGSGYRSLRLAVRLAVSRLNRLSTGQS